MPTWQKRMIRWCKLRLKLSVMSWLEPMQECFMLGVCTSWTVTYLFGWSSLVFFLVHVLCWFICDYMQLKQVQVIFAPQELAASASLQLMSITVPVFLLIYLEWKTTIFQVRIYNSMAIQRGHLLLFILKSSLESNSKMARWYIPTQMGRPGRRNSGQ